MSDDGFVVEWRRRRAMDDARQGRARALMARRGGRAAASVDRGGRPKSEPSDARCVASDQGAAHGAPSATSLGAGVAGVSAAPLHASERRRRCTVKTRVVRHGQCGAAPLAAHGRYLARDSAEPSDPFGQGYLTRHGQAMVGAAALDGWREDRHHFRIVLSPEDGARLDLKAFVDTFMARMEATLIRFGKTAAPLEWAAVIHRNTDHPHSHVVLRGQTADGRDLVLPKRFLQHGLRDLARDLATERLGYRSAAEMDAAQRRQIGEARFTDLDRALLLESRKGESKNGPIVRSALDPDRRARLDWLTARHPNLVRRVEGGMGGGDAFALDDGFERDLRALGEEGDVLRTLEREAARTPERLPLRVGSPAKRGVVESVTPYEGGPDDALDDRQIVVLRDDDGALWFAAISWRQAERLEVGSRISMKATRTLLDGRTTRRPFVEIRDHEVRAPSSLSASGAASSAAAAPKDAKLEPSGAKAAPRRDPPKSPLEIDR